MSTYIKRENRSRGFTLPELLVVAGVIALLIAVLLPALRGGLETAYLADSQNRLRQVATWMTAYSSENREHIVPSQFDYTLSAASYPVKARSDTDLGALQYRGTWTDLLWTYHGLGKSQVLIDPDDPANTDKYQYDSPDAQIFKEDSTYDDNPFRSAAGNTKYFPDTSSPGPKPFGSGAQEGGLPGYFAANNFFNADPAASGSPPPIGRWYVLGQIKAPDRSMYVVDSYAGETIEPEPPPFENDPLLDPATIEVDFRYNGACLMLFLDGHTSPEGEWTTLDQLENSRRIRVRNLDRN